MLAANFLALQQACDMLNKSEADWYHIDIMDGNFVPNISFGASLTKSIIGTSTKYNDVHLMVAQPEQYFTAFKDAGANNITIHVEACTHLHRQIEHIKQLGMQVGVAINPHTPVAALAEVLQYVDVVCLMSVNPGFGGQLFIPHTFTKLAQLKQIITANSYTAKIQIDGGVTLQNATALVQAGADILVAGSAIFNAQNPNEAIATLKQIC